MKAIKEIKKVVALMEIRGWDNKKLSKESNLNEVTIINFLSGKRKPTKTTIARIADSLGVEVEDLT